MIAPIMDPMIESRCPRMRADVAGWAGADKARFVHVFLACCEPRKIFGLGGQRNPLKSLDSDKRIQGNPSLFLGFLLLRLCLALLSLAKFGFCFESKPKPAGALRPHLPVAAHPVLEAAQLLDPDRPARVHAPGRDADLGPEAELAAVGELGRGVVDDDRRVDLPQEPLRGGLVLGD